VKAFSASNIVGHNSNFQLQLGIYVFIGKDVLDKYLGVCIGHMFIIWFLDFFSMAHGWSCHLVFQFTCGLYSILEFRGVICS